MNPSKMTPDELRLAIAEIVAKQNSWKVKEDWYLDDGRMAYCRDDGVFLDYVPNYPSDNNAALKLPLETNDEKRRFAIELAKIVVPDINIGTAGIVFAARFATARQHCEAWYNMRRNDG